MIAMGSGWPKSVVPPSVALVISFTIVFLLGWAFKEPAPAPAAPRPSPAHGPSPSPPAAAPQPGAPAPRQLVITVTLNSKKPNLEPSAVVEKLSIRRDNGAEDIDHLHFDADRLTYQLKDNHPATVCLTLKRPWSVTDSKPIDTKPGDQKSKERSTWCTTEPVNVQEPVEFDLGGGE